MDSLLEWARGPVFVFSLSFMLLGLLRHVLVTLYEMRRTLGRAGDQVLPYRQILKATAQWLLPAGKIRHEPLFSATSMIFHVALLVVPLFLGGHILLWQRGLGISWPAIPNALADVLTVVAVVAAVALVVQRAAARASRDLSRASDYLMPLIVALPFATGFLAMHPALNPFPHQPMLFLHVMSGNLVLVLMPITRLSHAVLLPGLQLVSELGWRWPIDSGSKVEKALGKQGEPI